MKSLQKLNGLHLKLLAVATMLVDHMGETLFPEALWMRCIGRLAFPIFAFLVAEGAKHTRNMKKYLLRMAAFAVVAEIPFDLAAGGTVLYSAHQNVLWTFSIALPVIWFAQRQVTTQRYNAALCIGAFLGFAVGQLTAVDYHGSGVLMVLLFYVFHDLPRGRTAEIIGMIAINCVLLGSLKLSSAGLTFSPQCLACFALVPIFLYNGQRGYSNRALQLGFYAFYPAHLLILGLLALYLR